MLISSAPFLPPLATHQARHPSVSPSIASWVLLCIPAARSAGCCLLLWRQPIRGLTSSVSRTWLTGRPQRLPATIRECLPSLSGYSFLSPQDWFGNCILLYAKRTSSVAFYLSGSFSVDFLQGLQGQSAAQRRWSTILSSIGMLVVAVNIGLVSAVHFSNRRKKKDYSAIKVQMVCSQAACWDLQCC